MPRCESRGNGSDVLRFYCTLNFVYLVCMWESKETNWCAISQILFIERRTGFETASALRPFFIQKLKNVQNEFDRLRIQLHLRQILCSDQALYFRGVRVQRAFRIISGGCFYLSRNQHRDEERYGSR